MSLFVRTGLSFLPFLGRWAGGRRGTEISVCGGRKLRARIQPHPCVTSVSYLPAQTHPRRTSLTLVRKTVCTTLLSLDPVARRVKQARGHHSFSWAVMAARPGGCGRREQRWAAPGRLLSGSRPSGGREAPWACVHTACSGSQRLMSESRSQNLHPNLLIPNWVCLSRTPEAGLSSGLYNRDIFTSQLQQAPEVSQQEAVTHVRPLGLWQPSPWRRGTDRGRHRGEVCKPSVAAAG